MLYIVSTPIGNLKDITYRAVEVLKTVDLIAAEDTRHTKILTNHYDIHAPLTSYFEHNKLTKTEYILKQLESGKNVALVTDAGTPGVSDPGYYLIKSAKERGIAVTVVPGATACIAALSLSGLPSDQFIFIGFLPNKSAARQKRLETLKEEGRTIIAYESVHRIVKTLTDIRDVLNNPYVACVREITKKFEEVIEGKADEVLKKVSSKKPKGEFVLVINLRI